MKRTLLLASLGVLCGNSFAAESAPQMLAPGFVVREVPVKLTSLNNIEYAPDGRLFAAGYDGRFHLLRDTDGDGLEDKVITFSPETSANYALGMVVKDGEPHALLGGEIVRFRDTNGDGAPDKRETVLKGFVDPAIESDPLLNHRRVDTSLALAAGPDGSWYVTMGSAAHNNPWLHAKNDPGRTGPARYDPSRRHGCLLRLTPDGRVEQLATGLRYVMSLQWNRHGDLFGTDQEGATWCPNGNPFDELLHLQPGRHYGFPPRHPKWLPNVVDEPSVWDYAPQHQSACGFRFNTPTTGRGRFGPAFWEDDAIVTGEARGKLWRTSLAKTAAGYVARNELFATMNLLVVDCAISPQGDLVICCHTGRPDWGNGPNGAGRVFKISYRDTTAPQPVLAWPVSPTETVVAFDRKLDAAAARDLARRTKIEFGRSVAAADELEKMWPGYAVVQSQRRQPRQPLGVKSARVGGDGRSLVIETARREEAYTYAVNVRTTVRADSLSPQRSAGRGPGRGAVENSPANDTGTSSPRPSPPLRGREGVTSAEPLTSSSPNPPALHLAHDLTGLAAEWRGKSGGKWVGWLPHPDFIAAKQFTRASSAHDALWKQLDSAGTLTLRGKLDLFNMLQPATQPGADLGYVLKPETVTLVFKSDADLKLTARGAKVERVNEHESRLTVAAVKENEWPEFALTVATPARSLEVAYFTDRDARLRAPGTRRFLMPFAKPGSLDNLERKIPEIAGGNWEAGRELFRGKAACITCHTLRGEGFAVGPDLNNLVHRDYASVLRDIAEPSAAINPDAVGYNVTLRRGEPVTGTRVGEDESTLSIAQAGGKIVKLKKADIVKVEPMTVSLMPEGMDKTLTPAELRDLMTYLLTESVSAKTKK
jgi:putative heme-binding domain-containing protein